MRLLASVAHHQAEYAADDLEKIADKQEMQLDRKKTLRDLQEYADKVITSGDAIDQAELNKLTQWMGELGVDNTGLGVTAGAVGNTEEADQRTRKDNYKNNVTDRIENAIKEVEDDQSLLQFKIQMYTSDLQNAENVRSQAEKRLETQRKDLTRNWGG
jgi:hypothetical protein